MIVVVIGGIVFLVGMVMAAQGVIGKEISSEGIALGQPGDPDHPGMDHPPDRHRLRLVLIGIGLMVVSVAAIAVLA